MLVLGLLGLVGSNEVYAMQESPKEISPDGEVSLRLTSGMPLRFRRSHRQRQLQERVSTIDFATTPISIIPAERFNALDRNDLIILLRRFKLIRNNEDLSQFSDEDLKNRFPRKECPMFMRINFINNRLNKQRRLALEQAEGGEVPSSRDD